MNSNAKTNELYNPQVFSPLNISENLNNIVKVKSLDNLTDYDYIFKILIVGPDKIGKTTLLDQYIINKINLNYNKTLNRDYRSKAIIFKDFKILIKFIEISDNINNQVQIDEYFNLVHGYILMTDNRKANIFNEYDFAYYSCKGIQTILKNDYQKFSNFKVKLSILNNNNTNSNFQTVNELFDFIISNYINFFSTNKDLYNEINLLNDNHIKFKRILKQQKVQWSCL